MASDAAQSLFIHPEALERCFLAADILAERYGQPYLEYGLLGLAPRSSPFHVVATPLLPGQDVTAVEVHQAGQNVLRLRGEIAELSKQRNEALLPIVFIHRHPGSCGMSAIDERFLTEVFVNQVATALTLSESYAPGADEFGCGCRGTEGLGGRFPVHRPAGEPRVPYGVAFSLIVNRRREHSIDAARKSWCPFCDRPRVQLLPAKLIVRPARPVSPVERRGLRRALEAEIEDKVRFDRAPAAEGSLS